MSTMTTFFIEWDIILEEKNVLGYLMSKSRECPPYFAMPPIFIVKPVFCLLCLGRILPYSSVWH